MKTLRLLSLCTLVPLCTQAMEPSNLLPVFFQFRSPNVPALNNKIQTIYVKEGDTFADAVTKLTTKLRKLANYNLSFMSFDLIAIPANRWPTIDIIREGDRVKLTGFAFGLMSKDTPISVSLEPK